MPQLFLFARENEVTSVMKRRRAVFVAAIDGNVGGPDKVLGSIEDYEVAIIGNSDGSSGAIDGFVAVCDPYNRCRGNVVVPNSDVAGRGVV